MAIKTISYHERSTGKTGQVLASTQIENKLSKVERHYEEYHGVPLGRVKFYNMVLDITRDVKKESGGYIQYTAEAVAGLFLEQMHRELGKAVRRKRQWKSKVTEAVQVKIGDYTVDNLRELARGNHGKRKSA